MSSLKKTITRMIKKTSLKISKYFDDNEEILNILKKYYTEINNFHSVINEAINGGNSQKLVEAYSLWHNNKDYYYHMFDDIKNAKEQTDFTIFSEKDFENFLNFLTMGLMPGECIYNLITFNSIESTRARYSLSESCNFDIIVGYFIENKIYDIFKIDETLFYYKEKLLSSK